MRLCILAIGQRMPSWVVTAWNEYARRFPRGFALDLREISAIKRSPNADIESIRRRECEALLTAVPQSSAIIALDERGKQWSTQDLSGKMMDWMQSGRDVAFLIGGADGLTAHCLAQAENCWSLGHLTLPHALVRIIVAEQLYRAWSMTQNHPYHRA